jgi:hypothetical protein
MARRADSISTAEGGSSGRASSTGSAVAGAVASAIPRSVSCDRASRTFADGTSIHQP